MGFFVQIPSKYENPVIIAYLLREKLGNNWDPKKLRREFYSGKLRDSELEECYFLLNRSYTTVEKFCSEKPYTWFLKSKDGLEIYSDGPAIYLDLLKPRIFFEVFELYSIPKGIKRKLTYINDILTAMNFSSPDWDKEEWEGEQFDMETIFLLENILRIRLQVWTKKFCVREQRFLYFKYYSGNQASSKTCTLHFQEESETFFMVDDVDLYFEKYHMCSRPQCFYTFKSKQLLEAHEKLCLPDTVKIVQEEYGPSSKLVRRAEESNLIPKCKENRNFIFYDIESVLQSSTVQTEKTEVLSTHKLVSIAVNR